MFTLGRTAQCRPDGDQIHGDECSLTTSKIIFSLEQKSSSVPQGSHTRNPHAVPEGALVFIEREEEEGFGGGTQFELFC